MAIVLADRPSEPDHEPQYDQSCSTRLVMVTQKAAGSVTEPAFPLGEEYGPPDQTVGGDGGGQGGPEVTATMEAASTEDRGSVSLSPPIA